VLGLEFFGRRLRSCPLQALGNVGISGSATKAASTNYYGRSSLIIVTEFHLTLLIILYHINFTVLYNNNSTLPRS
jgi:hypothetical protein